MLKQAYWDLVKFKVKIKVIVFRFIGISPCAVRRAVRVRSIQECILDGVVCTGVTVNLGGQ